MGDWGGALFNVLNRTADEPDFYQVSSLGPTEFNNETPWGRHIDPGWAFANDEGHFTEEYWFDDDTGLHVRMRPYPNELEAASALL